jgi:hypothetical protein
VYTFVVLVKDFNLIKMNKKMKIMAFVFLGLLIFSNLPFMTKWIDYFVGQDNYGYSNKDGTWAVIYSVWMDGNDFRVPKYLSTIQIDTTIDDRGPGNTKLKILPPGLSLRKKYPGADTTVYRISWKNPFTFWHWRYYIFGDEKFDFPYMSWKEIKKNRRFKGVDDSSFQDF